MNPINMLVACITISWLGERHLNLTHAINFEHFHAISCVSIEFHLPENLWVFDSVLGQLNQN